MKVYLAWFAAMALLTTACVSKIDQAGAADTNKPARPVVTSTSGKLWADVVTINGFTYNCVWAEDGGLGLALWCDRLTNRP